MSPKLLVHRARYSLSVLLVCLSGMADEPLAPPEAAASAAADPPGFVGTWETTYGMLTLRETSDGQLRGEYLLGGASCQIEGLVDGRRFEFRYQEPTATGQGWFELDEHGDSFSGRWREEGKEIWHAWAGRRVGATSDSLAGLKLDLDAEAVGFSGLWQTPHGRLRLIERHGILHGMFADARDPSEYFSMPLDGNRRVTCAPQPGRAGYWVSLELSEDGQTLLVRRSHRDDQSGSDWMAQRVAPEPGRRWLVVLEARWETNLEEQEYTFGKMLGAFFERTPHVQVRHRIFNGADDFQRYGLEIAFLAEPVVICVATHGSPSGVTVCDELLGPEFMSDVFRFADNTVVLHYSSCLIMAGTIAEQMHARLGPCARFPISGYASSVDWAGSAVIEFMYFDLILARSLTPEVAHQQTLRIMPFAGSDLRDSPVGAADFRIAVPGRSLPQAPEFDVSANLSLSFNGLDACVEVSDLELPDQGALTIEAWIRIAEDANPRAAGVPFMITGTPGMSIWTSAGYDWSARCETEQQGHPLRLLMTAEVGDMRGETCHVAAVWNGNTLNFFIDGQPAGQMSESLLPPAAVQGDRRLVIGAACRGDQGETMFHFRGEIDELRISSIARYLDSAGRPITFEPALRWEPDAETLMLYHCDEREGDRLIDASPAGRHGVIRGAVRVPSMLAP